MKMKQYVSWAPWLWWIVPCPILLMISRKVMGNHHVWYQGKGISLETNPFNHKDYQ